MTRRTLTFLACALFAFAGCQKAAEQQAAEQTQASESAHDQAAVSEAAHGHAAAPGSPSPEDAALHKADPKGNYGAGVVLQKTTAIGAILAQPADYEGKIVQVAGTVHEVCQRRGCWMELADGDATLRVKVTDGEIVFPVSAKGSHAVVEGVVEKIELDEAQHKAWKQHQAEERGATFDPSTVSGPLTLWQIAGLGARIDG